MDHDSTINWDEIRQAIPDCDDPDGPLFIIRSCLEDEQTLDPDEQTLDPYDRISKRIKLFTENLEKLLKDQTK